MTSAIKVASFWIFAGCAGGLVMVPFDHPPEPTTGILVGLAGAVVVSWFGWLIQKYNRPPFEGEK